MPEAHPYLTLKLAQALYKKPPGGLEPAERQHVEQVATRQTTIESRILATPEAAQIVLPASSLAQAIAEIRERFSSEEDYLTDLANAGLDPERLSEAIERDLTFDAVLEFIASAAPEVSDIDVEIFYFMHRARFQCPENRTLRHILITINDTLTGSDRETARSHIDAIRERVAKSPKRFAEQALKHSECPTALNGGLLGRLKSGQLYPELDCVAAQLGAGEISEVVESPMGFHLLQCVAVEAASAVALAKVKEDIRTHLSESRRLACQKAWISGLLKAA